MSRWLRTALAIAITLAILLPASASSTDSRAASSIQLGYGVNVAASRWHQVAELGFDWVKVYAPPSERLPFKVLYRVEVNGPPSDLEQWGKDLRDFVSAHKDYIEAYEIGNEPNLDWAWGGRKPDPGEYVQVLKVAYARIKEADPQAIVVTAGLATTGPAGMEQPPAYPQAWSDLLFIQAMYDHGAKGYFDALGSHPYGFAYPPEQDPWQVNGLAFRRAEQQRQVMVANGDGDKLIWATEWGWLLDPGSGCYDWGDWSTRTWQIVSQEQQADYLRRAFLYACRHWPWMGPMFVSNLDFSTVPWYHECEPMRWYSILNPDGSPRLAYTYLKEMPKPPCAKVYLPIAAKNYIAP